MKKRIISLVLAVSILISMFYSIGMFLVSASALDGTEVLEIKNLSNKYFEENNNASTKEGLEQAVKESFSAAEISEFFIYRSANGCFDEDQNPETKISIPGHDGYISAVITVESSNIGVIYTIPHTEENLGTLTIDTYSPENSNFVTKVSSGKVQITQYKGNAQKIIIPSTFEGTVAKLNNTGYTDEKALVKAVVIGGADKEMTVTVNNSAFAKMPNLETVVLPKTMNGKLNQFAFQQLKKLKYVSLPYEIVGETAETTTVGKGIFYECNALETAYCPINFKLPIARYIANSDSNGYKEQPFVNTLVDSFYLPAGITFAAGYDYGIFGAPTKSSNSVIVMTDEDQQSTDLCRAAVLAQQASDSIGAADTEDNCSAIIQNAYKNLTGGADITANWNNTFVKNGDKASGILTLSKNNISIDVNFSCNPNAGLLRLSVNDYSINPEFNPDVTDYSITVPYTENDISFSYSPMSGAVVVGVTQGLGLSVGANNDFITINTKSKNGSDIAYKISVKKSEEKVDINNSIADAMNKYVKETANECEKQELLDAVNEQIAPNVAKISQSSDYFIYHSVDCCYDEDDDQSTRISIPGHDGYVSAVFKVYDKNSQLISVFGNISVIPHIEENLGILSKSKDTDFEIDENGTLTNYTGSAKKVIIPSAVKKIDSTGAKDNKGLQKAVILVINGNCKIVNNSAFKSDSSGKWGWISLKAINATAVNQFAERAFSGLKSLKYVKFAATSVNPTDYFGYASFADNAKLVNAVLPANARLRGSVFSNTAIRDFIENGVNHQYDNTSEYYDYIKRAFKKGTSLILTAEDNKSVNLTMASVWAQIKADSLEVSNLSTQDSCLTAITNSYSSKKGGEKISADFGGTFTHNNEKASGILSLREDNRIIPVSLNCDPSIGLKYLSVAGQEITPDFSPYINTYNLTVPDSVAGLKIETCPANKATVNSITGNENIMYGETTVTIDTTAKDGTNVKYYIKVKRLKIDEYLKAKANEAISQYIQTVGNECNKEGLIAAVNSEVSPYSAQLVDNEYFVYHAVDGCYDEDEDETTRLSIPGHDGAVSAVMKFSKSGEEDVIIALSAAIPHIEENLGKLTKSKETDFVINEKGNITEYNGNAQKIIVPGEIGGVKVNNITSMTPKNAGAKKAIVIVTQNQGYTVNKQAFASDLKGEYGFINVVAADLSNNVIFGERAFSKLRNLKYLKLKTTNTVLKKDANDKSYNERGYFDYCAFADNPKLQNFNFPSNLTMKGRVFAGIATYDIYEQSGVVHNNTDEYANYQNPVVGNGERVVLTPKENENYGFARIVDLVQISIGKASVDADDDKNSVLEKCINDAVVAGAKFDSSWNYYAETDDLVKAELFVKTKEYSIALPFEYDKNAGLKKIFVSDVFTSQGLTESSEEGIDYNIDLYNAYDYLALSTVLQPGAKIVSVTGNGNLSVGNTDVILTVETPNGASRNYTIKVNRLGKKSKDEVINDMQEYFVNMELTNNSGVKDIVSAVEHSLKGQTYDFNILNWYMYKAVNGASEKGEVLVPGHNGAIVAVVLLSDDDRTANEVLLDNVVKPVMQEYEFKSVSKKSDFTLSQDGKTLLSYSGEAEKVVIPDGIEFIDELYLYSDADAPICIILPDSVRSLPSSFAYKMTNLEVLRMGDNVVKTGAGLCMNCASLKYVRLSENLPALSSTMFSHTLSLSQLYIPQSVTKIGSNALYRSLVRDVTLAKQITFIDENAFSWCINNATYFSTGALGSIITEEQGKKIQAEIVSKVAYNGGAAVPRTITVLNPKVEVALGAFAGDNTGAWGVNAVRAKQGSVFDNYFENVSQAGSSAVAKNNYSHLDMSFVEVVARAKVAAESIKLEKDATPDVAKSLIVSSYYSSQPVKADWKQELRLVGNNFVGQLEISNASHSVIIDINTPVFVKAEPLIENADEETDDYDYDDEQDDDEYFEDSDDYEDEYYDEAYYGTHEETQYKTVRNKILKKMRRAGNNDLFGIPIFIWIIGASVIVAAGATATVLVILKKKKTLKK